MNKYTSSDREIIRFLFEKDGWSDLYDLHVAFLLSPAQVLDLLERMVAMNFAEVKEIRARLTLTGREWVLAARKGIFFGTEKSGWKPSLEELTHKALDPSAPYLPKLRLVDRTFFQKLPLDNPE